MIDTKILTNDERIKLYDMVNDQLNNNLKENGCYYLEQHEMDLQEIIFMKNVMVKIIQFVS